MLYSVYLMLFGHVPYVIWVCTSCYLCVYLKLYSVYHMLFSDLVGTIWYKVCTLCYIVFTYVIFSLRSRTVSQGQMSGDPTGLFCM